MRRPYVVLRIFLKQRSQFQRRPAPPCDINGVT